MNNDIAEELFRATDEIVKQRLQTKQQEIRQEVKRDYQSKELVDAANNFDDKTIEGALAQLALEIKGINALIGSALLNLPN